MPEVLRIVVVFAVLLAAGVASAQSSYPTRPIRIVAPFAPGGPVDVGARILAPKLQEALGVQVYVDNVAGGSGNIGTAAVAKAPGDGYTLLVISSGFVVNPSMFKLSYDWERDLAPVSLVGLAPQVILVHPSVPATNMRELIALVKASPGKYAYGSAGLGTPGYLAGELLRQTFGIDLQHVPFQGGGPAVVSTVGGHTPVVITTISSASAPLQQGAIRPLAVTSNTRSPALPDVPTLAEQGIPDQESDVILGVLVPASTPAPIVARLNGEIVRIVGDPDIVRRLGAVGFEAVGSSPAEFDARIRSEIAKWARVIHAAGITPQ
ncbi:MAG: tripartite tricarboxylate transporter substrate binding protein [Hyphomicrobiales bacterium]|nr:tripartite tricarboxylate transporter substrate binding protein [Hyphomicrobiales bacterium]